jgi:hypothetical protein
MASKQCRGHNLALAPKDSASFRESSCARMTCRPPRAWSGHFESESCAPKGAGNADLAIAVLGGAKKQADRAASRIPAFGRRNGDRKRLANPPTGRLSYYARLRGVRRVAIPDSTIGHWLEKDVVNKMSQSIGPVADSSSGSVVSSQPLRKCRYAANCGRPITDALARFAKE